MREGAGCPEVRLDFALGFFDLRGAGGFGGFADEFAASGDAISVSMALQMRFSIEAYLPPSLPILTIATNENVVNVVNVRSCRAPQIDN